MAVIEIAPEIFYDTGRLVRYQDQATQDYVNALAFAGTGYWDQINWDLSEYTGDPADPDTVRFKKVVREFNTVAGEPYRITGYFIYQNDADYSANKTQAFLKYGSL